MTLHIRPPGRDPTERGYVFGRAAVKAADAIRRTRPGAVVELRAVAGDAERTRALVRKTRPAVVTNPGPPREERDEEPDQASGRLGL